MGGRRRGGKIIRGQKNALPAAHLQRRPGLLLVQGRANLEELVHLGDHAQGAVGAQPREAPPFGRDGQRRGAGKGKTGGSTLRCASWRSNMRSMLRWCSTRCLMIASSCSVSERSPSCVNRSPVLRRWRRVRGYVWARHLGAVGAAGLGNGGGELTGSAPLRWRQDSVLRQSHAPGGRQAGALYCQHERGKCSLDRVARRVGAEAVGGWVGGRGIIARCSGRRHTGVASWRDGAGAGSRGGTHLVTAMFFWPCSNRAARPPPVTAAPCCSPAGGALTAAAVPAIVVLGCGRTGRASQQAAGCWMSWVKESTVALR